MEDEVKIFDDAFISWGSEHEEGGERKNGLNAKNEGRMDMGDGRGKGRRRRPYARSFNFFIIERIRVGKKLDQCILGLN